MKIQVDLSDSPDMPAPTSYKVMMEVEESDGWKHVKINPSSLSMLQVCMRKAQLYLRDGWRAKTQSPALIFGSALHGALEVFYCGEREERQLPKDYQKEMELMAHGRSEEEDGKELVYTATREFIRQAAPLGPLPEGDKRSIANGVWILGHYFEAYINDPYTIVKHEGKPLVEKLLSHEVFRDEDLKVSITLFGTIDCILENQATGEIVICDHKTSSIVGNDFYNRLKPNSQYTAYTLLAQKILGLETNKFMVNCLQVKKRPTTARGTPPHFPRQITTRSPEDIEEFRQGLIYHVLNYLRLNHRPDMPMGSVDACANYGRCMFLDVCSSPQNLRPTILENSYANTGRN